MTTATAMLAPLTKSALRYRLGGAALTACAANAIIAVIAKTSDHGGIGMGLSPAMYLPATVAGIVAGAIGWTILARRSAKTPTRIVPAVLLVSWIPDLLLLTMGATAANVIGLMSMHLVVATAIVTAMRTRQV